MTQKTAGTAGSTTNEPKVERPSLGDAYGELTYDDDVAIRAAFNVEIDDLMEKLDPDTVAVACDSCGQTTFIDKSDASNADLLLIVRALELGRRLHEGMPRDQAILEARVLTKNQLGELLTAYLDHEPDANPDRPETDEGKGGSGAV